MTHEGADRFMNELLFKNSDGRQTLEEKACFT
jgi:hypothetical protein